MANREGRRKAFLHGPLSEVKTLLQKASENKLARTIERVV